MAPAKSIRGARLFPVRLLHYGNVRPALLYPRSHHTESCAASRRRPKTTKYSGSTASVGTSAPQFGQWGRFRNEKEPPNGHGRKAASTLARSSSSSDHGCLSLTRV